MQIGKQSTGSHRQGRETLAQFSEWMINRGFLFPRAALPAAKAYTAGQLRLTWLDAGSTAFTHHVAAWEAIMCWQRGRGTLRRSNGCSVQHMHTLVACAQSVQ